MAGGDETAWRKAEESRGAVLVPLETAAHGSCDGRMAESERAKRKRAAATRAWAMFL